MKNSDILLCRPRDQRFHDYWEAVICSTFMRDHLLATVLIYEEAINRSFNGDVDKAALFTDIKTNAKDLDLKSPFKNEDYLHTAYTEFVKLHNVAPHEAVREAFDTEMDHRPVAHFSFMNIHSKDFAVCPKKILIADAENFFDSLDVVFDEFPSSEFFLTTDNRVYKIALEALFDDKNVEVKFGDICSDDFIEDKYDLVVGAEFPGMIEKNKDGADNSAGVNSVTDLEINALRHLTGLVAEGGRLKILISDKITYASDEDSRSVRSEINRKFMIRGISELPRRFLNLSGYNLLNFIILDMERGEKNDGNVIVRECIETSGETQEKNEPESERVKIYDFRSRDELKGKKKNVKGVKFYVFLSRAEVPNREFSKRVDWYIGEYVRGGRDEDKRSDDLYKFLITHHKKKLGCCANIFRGTSVAQTPDKGSYAVINISDIKDDDIMDFKPSKYVDEKKFEKRLGVAPGYILQDGDVLLTSRGTKFKFAVFHEQKFKCVASSNILIVRPDDKQLYRGYLKVIFSSNAWRELVCGDIKRGETLNFSDRDLMFLEIPVPSMEDQREEVKRLFPNDSESRERPSGDEKSKNSDNVKYLLDLDN